MKRISFVRISVVGLFVLGFALLPRMALAAFHLMEIEQVIGGVGGDTSAQAVQLKMRLGGQNFVGGIARVRAFDATGGGAVTLHNFAANVNDGSCLEILLATPAMAAKTSPPLTGALTMAAIPPSYLAAGSLTFETTGGAVYWRVSWGGAAYTGPQTVIAGTGTAANDADGLTNPAFAGPLPSTTAQALRFTPPCDLTTGISTNNAAQYAVTAGPAVLKNNSAATLFTVVAGLPIPGLPGLSKLLLPGLLGLGVVAFGVLRRRRA